MLKEVGFPITQRSQAFLQRTREKLLGPTPETEQALKKQVFQKALGDLMTSGYYEKFEGVPLQEQYDIKYSGKTHLYYAHISVYHFAEGFESVGIVVGEDKTLQEPVRLITIQLSRRWLIEGPTPWGEHEFMEKLSGWKTHADGSETARWGRNFGRRERVKFLKEFLNSTIKIPELAE